MTAAPHATAVRDEVLKLLEQAPAYQALTPEAALALREHMIQIGTYLADPNAHGAATAIASTGVGNGHAAPST